MKIPDLELAREVDANALQQFALMAQVNLIHPRDLAAYSVGGDLHVQTIHRSTASELTDLVRHVIDDERRTNRALRLVGRLATVLFALLVFTGYVLTLLPAAVVTQLVVGAAVVLGVVVLAGVVFAVTLARRRRSRRLGG